MVAISSAKEKYWDGRRHLSSNQDELALEALNEAIRINPQMVEAYQSRVVALARLGREEDVAKDKQTISELIRRNIASTPTYVTSGGYEEEVGTGRYVLSFLFAGFIGLGVQYALRKKGWLGVGVNVAIGILALIIISAIPE